MTDLKVQRRIEQRLLDLAYTTDARITAGALAYFAPCSLDDANAVLDDLAARDRLRMTVEDDGTIVYELPGRERIGAAAKPTAAPTMSPPPPHTTPTPPPTTLVRHAGTAIARPTQPPSPIVAAALSFLVPGAGQLYARHVVSAIVWFFLVTAAYALILPGLILHVANIVSAAGTAAREQRAMLRAAAA